MVLLKNKSNALPLNSKIKKMAVFGRSSYNFIAGGTGSGDVNHAYVVNLIQGLENAGMTIDNTVKTVYEDYIPKATKQLPQWEGQLAKFLPKFLIPEMDLSNLDLKAIAKANDVAIVTVGKTSGEFIDRNISDNFNMTDAEKKMISDVCTAFHKAGKKVIVVLNVCGVIETKSWIDGPDAVLTAWLPGQEGGK